MALKRRQRISPGFSMSSMTDLIFLLLIFFMITSTMVSPNAIKVLLPQGSQQTSAKPMARIIIDRNLNYYGAFGNEDEMPLFIDEVTGFLQDVLPGSQKCMWRFMPTSLSLTGRLCAY